MGGLEFCNQHTHKAGCHWPGLFDALADLPCPQTATWRALCGDLSGALDAAAAESLLDSSDCCLWRWRTLRTRGGMSTRPPVRCTKTTSGKRSHCSVRWCSAQHWDSSLYRCGGQVLRPLAALIAARTGEPSARSCHRPVASRQCGDLQREGFRKGFGFRARGLILNKGSVRIHRLHRLFPEAGARLNMPEVRICLQHGKQCGTHARDGGSF